MFSVLTGLSTFASASYSVVGTALSLVVVALILALLVGKELVRAFDGSRAVPVMRRLDVALWPLFIAFGAIVVARFGRLLHLF